MKKILILGFVALSAFSCSKKDDNVQGIEQNNSGFVSRIENDAPTSYDTGDNFYYNEDKLQFIKTDACSGNIYYFEYGGNGKISRIYEFIDVNFDINTVNIQQIISENIPIDYVYEDGKLIRFDIQGIPQKYFRYYADGKLKEFEYPGNGKSIISYNGDQVSEITYIYLYTGEIYNYTFEFDDKINPLYKAFNQFGIFDIEICRSLEDMMMFRHLPIFKNNIKRVYIDNVLKSSATYQYFDNNYPERVITNEENGDQVSEFFTYL